MPVEQVKVPRVGESITEATVNRWMQPDGAYVKQDDPLVELGTDKASQEVYAQVAGKLKLLAKEGDTIAVDAVIAEIDTDAKAPQASGGRQPPVAEQSLERREQQQGAEAHRSPQPGPAATRLLAESGLKAEDVRGTGPGGRVIKGDVLDKVSDGRQPPVASHDPGKSLQQQGAHAPRSPGHITRQPMTQIRRRIAERLLESQRGTATLTTFNEADMSAIMDLRSRYNERFEKKHGVKLGFMSIFVKAAVEALKAFPHVNSRIDGNDIVEQHFYDLGVAVSTEKGLMVPIIRDADQQSFAEIEKTIGALAKKARDGKISVTDLEGGTFTITNGGIFGSMLSTPILNPPQSAILGMHNIQKRAVVVNDEIVIRPMMYIALSYDHRLIDGREAVQFLVRVKECVENPERMLLEV
jgi:2-oxoglutarate dehydrogenase E2 component (dihydrolipoamide succinyltransferase)